MSWRRSTAPFPKDALAAGSRRMGDTTTAAVRDGDNTAPLTCGDEDA